MKTRTLVLMLMAIITLNAWAFSEKDFVGTWQSKDVAVPSEDNSMTMTHNVHLTLNKDNTMEQTITMNLIMEISRDLTVDARIYVSAAGTYTLDGDTLKLIVDPATVKVESTEDDINIRGELDMFQANQLKKQLSQSFVGPMAEQIKNDESGLDTEFTITEFSGKKFSGKEENGMKYTFSLKKDKKKK